VAVIIATETPSGPRPFVALDIAYRCPRCKGERHTSQAIALADSGATKASIPARFLPDHVDWRDLPEVLSSYQSATRQDLRARLWHADLRVLGVRIATEVLVLEPGSDVFGYAVLGTGDLFEHFAVTFAMGNVPPFFALERAGQLLDSRAELPALPDVRIHHALPEPLDGLPDELAGIEPGGSVTRSSPELLTSPCP
jgi:hypothetical protein